MKYSTITQHKVGPYRVTACLKSDQSFMNTMTEGRHPYNAALRIMQECEEDYRDPEMSHEDMRQRLHDRLIKIEGVTQIDIVGVNDGCGVRISLEG